MTIQTTDLSPDETKVLEAIESLQAREIYPNAKAISFELGPAHGFGLVRLARIRDNLLLRGDLKIRVRQGATKKPLNHRDNAPQPPKTWESLGEPPPWEFAEDLAKIMRIRRWGREVLRRGTLT
jgi:hypothetical protein